MTGSDVRARVFLSYSRTDLEFVRSLRDSLTVAGLDVWHDLKDIGTGQWWSQIEDSLDGSESVEHVVLVVSPRALTSRVVEREWRLARLAGKTVSPVLPAHHRSAIDFAGLPAWMQAQHFYDLDAPEQRQKLIDVPAPARTPASPADDGAAAAAALRRAAG